ncbi:MAG TPA: ferrochelatase [Steroidobacteraceae bacterium]|nr:ferrochelatase [Steroidobacteraceae bacterium]
MPAATGVLVVNLGTPDAPTPQAVRRFLAEILSDRRVVDLPRLPWQAVLRAFILPFRPAKSARAYQQIWTPAGSPLLTGTEALARALGRRLAALEAEPPVVTMGMTYGNPSIGRALEKLAAAGVGRIVVLPLYPQYSATTVAAALDRVDAALAGWDAPPERLAIEGYHAEPGYIDALAASIRAARTSFDHLVFSFHGIPQRYSDRGDPYAGECAATARLVAEKLALPAERWSVAYQSRVGRARWLQPYTEDRLRALAVSGVARVAVACPGFAVDCVETLEEIAIRGAMAYVAAGGVDFQYIPALNDDAAQVDCLARLALARLGSGPEAPR